MMQPCTAINDVCAQNSSIFRSSLIYPTILCLGSVAAKSTDQKETALSAGEARKALIAPNPGSKMMVTPPRSIRPIPFPLLATSLSSPPPLVAVAPVGPAFPSSQDHRPQPAATGLLMRLRLGVAAVAPAVVGDSGRGQWLLVTGLSGRCLLHSAGLGSGSMKSS